MTADQNAAYWNLSKNATLLSNVKKSATRTFPPRRYAEVLRVLQGSQSPLTGHAGSFMIRNPHNSTPRTMRGCTFCDWADPIERPAPRAPLAIRLYAWALVVAAVGLAAWRLA